MMVYPGLLILVIGILLIWSDDQLTKKDESIKESNTITLSQYTNLDNHYYNVIELCRDELKPSITISGYTIDCES